MLGVIVQSIVYLSDSQTIFSMLLNFIKKATMISFVKRLIEVSNSTFGSASPFYLFHVCVEMMIKQISEVQGNAFAAT